ATQNSSGPERPAPDAPRDGARGRGPGTALRPRARWPATWHSVPAPATPQDGAGAGIRRVRPADARPADGAVQVDAPESGASGGIGTRCAATRPGRGRTETRPPRHRFDIPRSDQTGPNTRRPR